MEVCYIENCQNEAKFFCSCRNNLYICQKHLPEHQELGYHSMQLLYLKLHPETKSKILASATKTIQSLNESISFAKNRANSLISQINNSLESTLKSFNKMKLHYEGIIKKCNNQKGISRNDYQGIKHILDDFGVKDMFRISEFSSIPAINSSLQSLKALINDLSTKLQIKDIENYSKKSRDDYVFKELIEYLSQFSWEKVKKASLAAMKILQETKKKSLIELPKMIKNDINLFSTEEEIYTGIGFLFEEKVDYKVNVTLGPAISSLLKQELTKTILNTCANINAIRPFLPKELENFSLNSSIVDFVKSVETTFILTNSELVKVLMHKFDFYTYCLIIKQFFLFGQGEFYYLLFEELFLHNRIQDIGSLFKECIYRSNARLLPEKCWKEIQFKGDDNFYALEWDSFMIHYKVDYPLNLFISKEVFTDLQQIFSLVWQVRRVDFIIKQNPNNRLIMKYKINSELTSLLHNLQILRFRFIVFIGNSLFFIMEEVIESAWKRFKSRISSALNLENFDYAIKEMTFAIKERVFINNKELSDVFYKILSLIIQFVDLQREVEIPIMSNEDTDLFDYSETKERLENIVKKFEKRYKKFKQSLVCSGFKSTCGSFFYQS